SARDSGDHRTRGAARAELPRPGVIVASPPSRRLHSAKYRDLPVESLSMSRAHGHDKARARAAGDRASTGTFPAAPFRRAIEGDCDVDDGAIGQRDLLPGAEGL